MVAITANDIPPGFCLKATLVKELFDVCDADKVIAFDTPNFVENDTPNKLALTVVLTSFIPLETEKEVFFILKFNPTELMLLLTSVLILKFTKFGLPYVIPYVMVRLDSSPYFSVINEYLFSAVVCCIL